MSDNNQLITIEAKFVRETDKSYLLDCEGDVEWFPKSSVKFNRTEQSLVLPKWLHREKFPNEPV